MLGADVGKSWEDTRPPHGSSRAPGLPPLRKLQGGHLLTRASLPALCLAQMARTQQGTLPRPSISAEPGSVVPWERPVTLVCRGPAGVTSFRLEKNNRSNYRDVGVTSRGEQGTEVRFPITALREDAVGHYRCIYQKESTWSELSEALSLEGTAEAVSALPTGPPGGVSSPTAQCCSSAGLSTEQVYILTGVSVAFLLCLFLLVLLLLHRQHQRKRGPPRSKDEEQRCQGRLSPAVDVLDGTSDAAGVDRFPDADGEAGTSTPDSGGPQEVTYAQLNHKPLTQRAARAVFLLSTEPQAESSMYATIARH
ncbi:leukocyte-associated immunoglobulin-like receptor 1 isoform X2 [Moschus berezovskii]|uniref:leukocyte-associated immunoglobulin-like receptor 1 isoform X2 n=1 Tax=Moschus berezovskii TaxID=68408 RepID=UPI002444B090|nr:leukocyte-associated immunoglobulin-like receptor 1 isoform X2 [Moschus berezovskii]